MITSKEGFESGHIEIFKALERWAFVLVLEEACIYGPTTA
jgi:hypothetical protein